MNIKARALQALYLRGKVSKDGLKQATADGVLTVDEFQAITSEAYAAA